MLKTLLAVGAVSLSALAGVTGLSFDVYTMQVLDMRIPYTMHNISFVVNTPTNSGAAGGSAYEACAFGWYEGSGPTDCWTICQTATNGTSHPGTYLARLDSYNGPDAFNISIWQKHQDASGTGKHNHGVVDIQDGHDGYYCSHGAQTTQCSIGFPFTPIPVPFENGDGCEPYDDPICT